MASEPNIKWAWRIEQRVTRPDGSKAVHISRPVGRWSLDRHWIGYETLLNVPLDEALAKLVEDKRLSAKYKRS